MNSNRLKADWFFIGTCVSTGLLSFGLEMYFLSAVFFFVGAFIWYSSNLFSKSEEVRE